MFLVDTNVVSELARREPDPAVLDWWTTHTDLAFSAVTIEELTFGVERIPDSQNARLRKWLSKFLAIPPLIIAVDEPIARLAGRLRAAAQRAGQNLTQADMLIAATALISGRTLVTRNAKDFCDCGVTVLNPFQH